MSIALRSAGNHTLTYAWEPNKRGVVMWNMLLTLKVVLHVCSRILLIDIGNKASSACRGDTRCVLVPCTWSA